MPPGAGRPRPHGGRCDPQLRSEAPVRPAAALTLASSNSPDTRSAGWKPAGQAPRDLLALGRRQAALSLIDRHLRRFMELDSAPTPDPRRRHSWSSATDRTQPALNVSEPAPVIFVATGRGLTVVRRCPSWRRCLAMRGSRRQRRTSRYSTTRSTRPAADPAHQLNGRRVGFEQAWRRRRQIAR